jgi:mRNA-degrading endonuclease RelE of RelBE toxin-antitoxin system
MMSNVSILREVQPLLEKLKRIQTEKTKPIVDELEDKLSKKQYELQLRNDQMKLEIQRLTSL